MESEQNVNCKKGARGFPLPTSNTFDRVGSLSKYCVRVIENYIIIVQVLPVMKLYKGVDGINIAIMTCANYNCTDANAVEREQVEYFRSGLEFLKEEYPTFHVVDSRIHYDEKGLPHMHTSMLSIHVKENGDKTFNVSQHQKGKDYFRGFKIDSSSI